MFLTYAARRGHALIDRALYLPRSWTEDPDRCTAAGVPDGIEFSTKPVLAAAMITRAIEAGVPAGCVAGDEVYGADPALRATVRAHQLGYVLQVAASARAHRCCADPCRRAGRGGALFGMAGPLCLSGQYRPPLLRLCLYRVTVRAQMINS